jgi:PAS domain-containing protein
MGTIEPRELETARAFAFPSRVDVASADSIGDPAFVVDTHGVVVSCNKEAAWLFGRPARQVIGRRCFSVVRACLPSGEPACSARCPLVQGLGILPGPPAVELVVRGSGHPAARYAINVQHIPLTDTRGLPSGLLHILTLAGPPGAADDLQVATA